jgi:two-component system, cell cycle sensor histidine kinase and response regulator CckA
MDIKKDVSKDMTEILIVEDSPTQAEQLTYILDQHGYKVLAANNGRQALSLVDKHNPALVITDIVMPEIDGYELCRRIKSLKDKQDIPVILLTSLSSAEDVLDGLECGADNFITKPYDEEYLLLHVEQVIANRKLFKNERVRVGLEIMFGGKRRFVTADQQQMLTLLISTYEEAVRKNSELVKTRNMYKELSENLGDIVKERTAALNDEIDVRKKAEICIGKLNRIYSMLSNINQAIVRIREPQMLFREVCRIGVEESGLKLACIELIDPSTGKVKTVASAGIADDYFEKAHIAHGDKVQENDAIGYILHSGKHFVWYDTGKKTYPAPWHEDALRIGIHSLAAFPLKVSGQVRGVFKLYAAEAGFFNDEELDLFDELAMDISFAMEFAEKEAERKLATKQLIDSETRYRRLFESAKDGILILDSITGVVVDVNPFLVELIGYSKEQLLEKHLWEIGIFKDIVKSKESFIELQEKKYIRYENLPLERSDGRKIDVEFVSNLYLVNGGEVIQCNIRDITERKLAENKLRESEDKHKKLEDQLRQSQKLEAIGQLSSGIAHDFNNLLGGIMGHAELLKMTLDHESPLMRHPKVIISSCEKASDLTRQLLAFARKAPVELQKINLNAFLKQFVELMGRTIDQRIEIVTTIQEQPTFIYGDRNQLENALLNIVINARDAMPEGGKLYITKETADLNSNTLPNEHDKVAAGAYVRISIADTGIGMSNEVKDHIFEPFFTTKEVGKGTGLGLASVYGCIKQHNGYIAVESQEGKGAQFDLYFPIVTPDEPVAAIQKKEVLLRGEGMLLVVDDEPMYHDILTEMFGSLGYNVQCCNSGAEAVEYFREHKLNKLVVILDMNMPKMTGLQCFRYLKEINPAVQVIISSGYGESRDRENLQKEGVRMFVQKPYKTAEMSMKIAELMQAQIAM